MWVLFGAFWSLNKDIEVLKGFRVRWFLGRYSIQRILGAWTSLDLFFGSPVAPLHLGDLFFSVGRFPAGGPGLAPDSAGS